MTRNQIEYAKHVETKRANRAQEELTFARDQANRVLGFATLDESKRHNLASEQQAANVLGEQTRHNLATEAVSEYSNQLKSRELDLRNEQLQETLRHNMQLEDLQSKQIEISHRSQEEIARHNLAQESRDSRALSESIRHNVSLENLQLRTIGEANRHNLATEYVSRGQLEVQNRTLLEQERSHRVDEAERYRHNRAQESIQTSQVGLGYAQVGLGYSQLAEAQRSNVAREVETHRSNTAKELELRRSNMMREQQNAQNLRNQRALGLSQLNEQKRHNLAWESAQDSQVAQGWVNSISGALGNVSKSLPLIGGFIS